MRISARKYKEFTKDEISLRRDEIFKIVLGTNQRAYLLKDFLEAILKKKITNVVVRNEVTLERIHTEGKEGRLDILAEVDNKELINIEIQNKNNYNIVERSEFYGSSLYHNSLKEGMNYKDNIKTVVIVILGYNLFEEGPYHEKCELMREWNKEVVSDNIVYHYIQLPRFIESLEEIKTDEEAWLAYISNQLTDKELKGVFKMKRSIEEIDEIVKIVMEDKDVNDELNRRIFNEYDKRAALRYAEQKGERKKSIELAKKMLEIGRPVEEIVKVTELSKEEIENIDELIIELAEQNKED